MRRSVLLLTCTLIVTSCSGPTVDGSSDQALSKSVAAVRKAVPRKQKDAFDAALKELAFTEVMPERFLDFEYVATALDSATVGPRLNGMTGKQIIAEAEILRIEREKKTRRAITELEAELAATQRSAELLSAFEITAAVFKNRRDSYGQRLPSAEIAVRSGLKAAISHVYFRGVLTGADGTILIDEEFNYRIPGGLKPGTSAVWTFGLSSFGDWGRINASEETVLTVETVRVNNLWGEPLIDASPPSKKNQERLEALRQILASD